ncbi:penicillin acylase family protein [Yinghuangia sp. ASG 101]|uniref:penicillin acylase family protein n=1 Tax=Yinghuangia sp. ASG 101 TaxID=2896848 RepID=UPI001E3B7A94|nr:penicillin acylase family protein [Yinghuangia sp. ASG 101]UGQ15510.1 penicillin acylase family protein [Yinghuangia sp. ASG 101]
MRRFRNAVIAFVVVLAVVVGALGWYAYDLSRRSFPDLDGRVKIAGLAGDVEVLRDKNGIPQIYADTPEDLFRAQGYVQAQDRFWEMDVRRHMTAGRLSEMFGSSQVDNDIFLRTLGWHRVAEQEVEKLSPEARAYVEAYAAGVNAYMKGRDGDEMSFEYTLLGFVRDDYKPEPWTAVDSVAWLKAMAWDLRANLQDEIDRALLSEKLTVNQIDELYPPYPYERNQPIVTNGAIVKEGNPTVEAFRQDAAPTVPSKSASKALTELSETLEQLPPIFTDRSSGVGSNSWVVSGSRTTTGKPLLANDPHLSASLPSVWYQMGLHCRVVGPQCAYDVSGYTFAGMPGVIIGHNQKIAWGLTNLGADVTDLYLEKVNDTGYLYNGAYQPFEDVRTEVIKVSGGEDRTITVRSTRHGPILSEASDELEDVGKDAPIPDPGPQREDGFAVALRWTALDPGTTMESVFQLDRATDWNTFRDALRGFEVPSQNVVYADVEGNIGYQAPGRIPIRLAGDGRWPAYGWDPKYEWDSMIPFDSLPTSYNPPEGYIVTANNAVTTPTYPYSLTTDWGYGARSQRIIDMINSRPKIDPQAMSEMQMDDRNPIADTLVPYLLAVEVDDPWVREAQNLLKDWDGRQSSDSKAAAYFNGVWRQLLLLAFGDKMPFSVRATGDCQLDPTNGKTNCGERDDNTALPDGGDRWFEVVRNLLPDAESPWWNISDDPGRITTRDALLLSAMTSARKELTAKMGKDIDSWSWGRLHTLELKNQTLGTDGPGIVKWMLNRGKYELGGGEGLVNASGWNAARGYAVTTVPSMRMIVDLADLDASRWINLTGASGHVWHDNYTDQTDLWKKGKTLPWAFSRPAVDEAAKHTLTLEPDPDESAAPGAPPGADPAAPGASPSPPAPSESPTGTGRPTSTSGSTATSTATSSSSSSRSATSTATSTSTSTSSGSD